LGCQPDGFMDKAWWKIILLINCPTQCHSGDLLKVIGEMLHLKIKAAYHNLLSSNYKTLFKNQWL